LKPLIISQHCQNIGVARFTRVRIETNHEHPLSILALVARFTRVRIETSSIVDSSTGSAVARFTRVRIETLPRPQCRGSPDVARFTRVRIETTSDASPILCPALSPASRGCGLKH